MNKQVNTTLAIVVIIIIAGAIGAYTLFSCKDKTQPTTPTTTTTISDETVDRQTYRNEEHKYQISYPDSYKLAENKAVKEMRIYKNDRTKGVMIRTDAIISDGYLKQLECLSSGSSQDILISGISSSKYYLQDGYTQGDCEKVKTDYPDNESVTFIIISYKGKYYEIHYYEDVKENINQILSTFKFVDSDIKNVISPDSTKVAFFKLNNDIIKKELFVSNVDGSNLKKIATQASPEGQGVLVEESLSWSADGKSITYKENQVTCREGCKGPEDWITMQVTYKVDIANGSKTVISETPLD